MTTRILSAAVLAAMVCGAGVTGCDKLRGPEGPPGKDGKPGRAGLDGEVAQQHGKPCVQDDDCGGLRCDGHSRLCRSLTDAEVSAREFARRQERVAKTNAAVEAAQAELDHAGKACVDGKALVCPAWDEGLVKLNRAKEQLAHDEMVAAEALPGVEVTAGTPADGKKAASGDPLQTASDRLLALQTADAVCTGEGGTCFNSVKQECSAEPLNGKCGGGKSRVCCPKGAVAEKKADDAAKPTTDAGPDATLGARVGSLEVAKDRHSAVLDGVREDIDAAEKRITASEAAIAGLKKKAGDENEEEPPADEEDEAPEPTAGFRPPWVAEGTATATMWTACLHDRERRFQMRGMEALAANTAAVVHCRKRYGLPAPQ